MGEVVNQPSIYEALRFVQLELKAPKGQRNRFGNYDYRSAEDILESVKPVLADNNLTLVITDEIELIGDRYYVKATAVVTNERGDYIDAAAYAREAEDKKGMDSAQVTGATSSYARKYALNGLFAIDDSKDADTDEHRNVSEKRGSTTTNKPQSSAANAISNEVTAKQLAKMNILFQELGVTDRDERLDAVAQFIGHKVESSKELTKSEGVKVIDQLINLQDGKEPQERTWK